MRTGGINVEHGEDGETGGADRDRTGDPLLAKQVLSQLSYSPSLIFPAGGAQGPLAKNRREPSASQVRQLIGGSGWTRTIDPTLIKRVL